MTQRGLRQASAKHADWFWYVGVNRPDKLPLRAKVIAADRHTLLARLAKPRDGR